MTSVELFCGAGGLAVGLKRVGFNTIYAVDFDKHAVATFKRAGLSAWTECADVNAIDWTAKAAELTRIHGQLDLLTAGPPCQGFSLAGKGAGEKDARNGFPATLEAIAALKPRAVLIENVKGLTMDKHLPYLERVVQELTRG